MVTLSCNVMLLYDGGMGGLPDKADKKVRKASAMPAQSLSEVEVTAVIIHVPRRFS